MLEPLIRMHTFEPVIITAEEYEQLQKEVITRSLLDDTGAAERILAKLLLEHMPRYVEIKKKKGLLV